MVENVSPTMVRITIEKPVWTQQGTEESLQAALLLRIQNKFSEAQEALESLLTAEAGAPELSFRSVWLSNQILKTQYERGHFKEVLV